MTHYIERVITGSKTKLRLFTVSVNISYLYIICVRVYRLFHIESAFNDHPCNKNTEKMGEREGERVMYLSSSTRNAARG